MSTPDPRLSLWTSPVADPFVPGWQPNRPPPAATNALAQPSETIQPRLAATLSDTDGAMNALSATFSRLSLADGVSDMDATAPNSSQPADQVARTPSSSSSSSPSPSPPSPPSHMPPLHLAPPRASLPLPPISPPPGFTHPIPFSLRLARLRAQERLLLTPDPPLPRNPKPKPKPKPPGPYAAPPLSPVRSIWRQVDVALNGHRGPRRYGATHPVLVGGRRRCFVLVERERERGVDGIGGEGVSNGR
ncbi:hypothetical protein B5807_02119 [Epicoccum nigrum]|uniref:Uncharacterized protein n=1 Tax=Epicoccum nigrum TaxID=105696 RepID=A0A1Y2M8K9_EPING|nr:hypothetical protein B5807_02119 [Epicoccum nigrum]